MFYPYGVLYDWGKCTLTNKSLFLSISAGTLEVQILQSRSKLKFQIKTVPQPELLISCPQVTTRLQNENPSNKS